MASHALAILGRELCARSTRLALARPTAVDCDGIAAAPARGRAGHGGIRRARSLAFRPFRTRCVEHPRKSDASDQSRLLPVPGAQASVALRSRPARRAGSFAATRLSGSIPRPRRIALRGLHRSSSSRSRASARERLKPFQSTADPSDAVALREPRSARERQDVAMSGRFSETSGGDLQ